MRYAGNDGRTENGDDDDNGTFRDGPLWRTHFHLSCDEKCETEFNRFMILFSTGEWRPETGSTHRT